MTLVSSSIGDTENFSVEVGLHQGSALTSYLFILVIDVITEEMSDKPPKNMMFANDIALSGNTREEVEKKTEDWRRLIEERGLKVNKTEYMVFNDVRKKSISMKDFELNGQQ
jgi:hypothetical protein